MDRLVIESTLSDVDDIFLSENTGSAATKASIVLGFKAANMDQVVNAMESLMALSKQVGVELAICKTLQSGIYDIEIRCEDLDEPIRLMNKAISYERLGAIQDYIRSERELVLSANVCGPGYEIKIKKTEVKDCSVKV